MWSGVPYGKPYSQQASGFDASRQFDTPCFFGRDVTEFKHFAKSWYGDKLQENKMGVRRLVNPLEPEQSESASDQPIAPAISDHTISIAECWRFGTTPNPGGFRR